MLESGLPPAGGLGSPPKIPVTLQPRQAGRAGQRQQVEGRTGAAQRGPAAQLPHMPASNVRIEGASEGVLLLN